MFKICVCLISFLLSFHGVLAKEGRFKIVGSATAFPFLSVVMEDYSKFDHRPSPIMEVNGTGAGLKFFCHHAKEPIIAAASRKISKNEREICKKFGVDDLEELLIGSDGIIFAINRQHSKKMTIKNFQINEIFRSISKTYAKNLNWNDINPTFPKLPIKIYGPIDGSGTKESLKEKIMQPFCHDAKDINCLQTRNDESFVDLNGNNLIVQKLLMNRNAFGFLSYGFYKQNIDSLLAMQINGVAPSDETIANEQYSLSRPLYVYVRKSNLLKNQSISKFINLLLSDEMIGENGELTKRGLIKKEEPKKQW